MSATAKRVKFYVGATRSAWRDVREDREAGFSWVESFQHTAEEFDQMVRDLEALRNSPEAKERPA